MLSFPIVLDAFLVASCHCACRMAVFLSSRFTVLLVVFFVFQDLPLHCRLCMWKLTFDSRFR